MFLGPTWLTIFIKPGWVNPWYIYIYIYIYICICVHIHTQQGAYIYIYIYMNTRLAQYLRTKCFWYHVTCCSLSQLLYVFFVVCSSTSLLSLSLYAFYVVCSLLSLSLYKSFSFSWGCTLTHPDRRRTGVAPADILPLHTRNSIAATRKRSRHVPALGVC